MEEHATGAVLPEFMPEMSHNSPVIAWFFNTTVLQELLRSGRVRVILHQINFSKRNL